MDPFGARDDATIWKALKLAKLGEFVAELPGGNSTLNCAALHCTSLNCTHLLSHNPARKQNVIETKHAPQRNVNMNMRVSEQTN